MTFTEIVTLEKITCGECGVPFAMPTTLVDERRENGKSFYCPNGHSRAFIESELDKAIKERDAALRDASAAKMREQLEREQKLAAESSLSKLKKRNKNGVCPCCKRTFKQLAAHMKCKHPKYAEPDEKEGK